jgi:hypothetical protein
MNPFIRIAFLVLMLASAGSCASAASPPENAGVPDATITISGGVIAFGIGYEWAHGVLTYHGQRFPFRVQGVSVMDIGAGAISGTGEVFNLKDLPDFAGHYAGSAFGSAISRGSSLGLVKNESGVTIRARSTVSGVRLNFSGNGIRIRFTVPLNCSGAPTACAVHDDL